MRQVVAVACGVMTVFGMEAADAAPPVMAGNSAAFQNGEVRLISSSHQDTAWMDTPDYCRRFRIEQNIVPALEMMKQDANYCFAMECTLHLMEFLEAYPERKDEVVRRMKEGRLEFGATYNQPYESCLSGEELARQLYYGRRWIRKNLPGCDARVAFNPDVPGRALQMQQILAKAGVPYLSMSRYHEGFYRWFSPDGSSVLTYSPGHYYNPHSLLLNFPVSNVVGRLQAKLAALDEPYRQRAIPLIYPLINSQDFSKPVDFRPLIAAWNAQTNTAGQALTPRLAYGSMIGAFERLDTPQARYDTRSGERPDVWLYIHGPTHHRTTSLRREAARLLPAAEAFSTFAGLLGNSLATYPTAALEQAWKDEIYIDHGIGGKNGHITDEVFHRKVLSARDTGRALLNKALGAIAARVKNDPARGTPVTVFNTLSWVRAEPVEWTVPASLAGTLRVTDARGRVVPSQATTLGTPEEVNVAAASMGAKASASSAFGADYGPENAIDGRWAVRDPDPALGSSDKWNSAAGPGPHELVVDFGQARTIHLVAVRHEGVMGVFKKEVCDNTADFQIQGAGRSDGPWADLVAPVTGNTASLTVHRFAPTTVRYLRLVITKGTQADNAFARIYEVQAFAKADAPERRLVFVAPEVPALGYKTFYVSQAEEAAGQAAAASPAEATAESRYYRLTLAPGGIRSLYDKQQKRELLKTDRFLGGEVFTMLSVAPDNRGKGTDAGEFGAVPMPVMDGTFDRVSLYKPEWKRLESGPVRTVYGLEQPWKNTTVRQRVVLWNGLRRVDLEVELAAFNGELWREFRMALPLALAKPSLAYEVPMGVVEIGKDELPGTGGHAYGKLEYFEECRDIRPREVQNFVDASDSVGGVTLSSDVSVFDWKNPADTNDQSTVLQPVLLASRKSCNGEGNWYPQAGDHRYRYSLTSHAGDWRQGWRQGVAANHPFEAVSDVPAAAGAAMPSEMAFLELSAKNATICAVKKAEDDDRVVVRLVDMEGHDSQAAVTCFLPVLGAVRASILEEGAEKLDSSKRSARLPLGRHAIETLLLRVDAAER